MEFGELTSSAHEALQMMTCWHDRCIELTQVLFCLGDTARTQMFNMYVQMTSTQRAHEARELVRYLAHSVIIFSEMNLGDISCVNLVSPQFKVVAHTLY